MDIPEVPDNPYSPKIIILRPQTKMRRDENQKDVAGCRKPLQHTSSWEQAGPGSVPGLAELTHKFPQRLGNEFYPKHSCCSEASK